MTRSQREALQRFEREVLSLRQGRTRELHRRHVRAFLDALDVAPSQITARHVEAHLAQLAAFAASTQARVLSSLRVFCCFLVAEGTLATDPTKGLRVRVPEQARLVLSQGQVQRLLRSALDENPSSWRWPVALRNRALLELLYCLGLRRAEAVAAQVADLDLARGALLVRRVKCAEHGVLPLPPAALEAVRSYLRAGRPRLIRGRDSGRLLVSVRGRALAPTDVSRIVRQVGQGAGVEVHAHALRRACATHLVEAGVDLRTVQLVLGHGSLEHTARYVGVRQEEVRQSIDRLNGVGCRL